MRVQVRGIRWASVAVMVQLLLAIAFVQAQAPTASFTLTIKELSGQSLNLGPADFAKLPRVHVSAVGHDGKKHEYDGANLRDLLRQAEAVQGDNLRGKEMADYVVAEGSDGYRVVFSLAELEPDFGNTQVIVADKMDGQPLPTADGALRLVVPSDKRPTRWVRMLTTITIARAP